MCQRSDSTAVQLLCTVQLLSLQHCTGCTRNEGNAINTVNTGELVFQPHPFRSILHKCRSSMWVGMSVSWFEFLTAVTLFT